MIATLGVSSTLVAWYLARTRGSDDPQQSRLRARDLGHLLREVDMFILDCGHEPGNKWDDKINGFRLTLGFLGSILRRIQIRRRTLTPSKEGVRK